MVRIELTPEQSSMLHRILDSYLSDLRMEIAGTDQMDFREGLKRDKEFIEELMTRLQPPR